MSLRIESDLLVCAGVSLFILTGCGNSPNTGTTSVVHNEWTRLSAPPMPICARVPFICGGIAVADEFGCKYIVVGE